MHRRWLALTIVCGSVVACEGGPETVEVTNLAGDRFRVSVVAPDIAAGRRIIAPEAEKLCGDKPAGIGEALMEPAAGPAEPKVVQEIACGAVRAAPPRNLAEAPKP